MTTTIEVRSVDTLEESGLRQYRAGLVRAGKSVADAKAATAKGTPIQLRTRMIAEMMGQVFANERALEDAQMPDTSTTEDLERLCAIYGVERSPGSGAAGDVTVTCTGSVTFAAGAELRSDKTQKVYQVVATTTVANGGSVGVVGKSIGKATDLAAGQTLTWTSPPGGSAPQCVVAIAGLINGQDADNDARLRARLLKRLQAPPGAGNWAHVRQWAEDASASVEDAYVYCAVHGPGTTHAVVTIEGTAANGYNRIAPDALVAVVNAAVTKEYPQPADVVVSAAQWQNATLAVRLSLPEPIAGTGPGGGWLDVVRWPVALTTNGVAVTSVITSSIFRVNAVTAPSVGDHIAFWDSVAFVFRHAIVVSYTGSSGLYVLTLDRALTTILVGAFVSPDAERLDDYARVLCEQMATLGPGQRTTVQRAQRKPTVSPERPAAISTVMLAKMQEAHVEMTSAVFVGVNNFAFTAPVMPNSATTLNQKPYIHKTYQIGFYS